MNVGSPQCPQYVCGLSPLSRQSPPHTAAFPTPGSKLIQLQILLLSPLLLPCSPLPPPPPCVYWLQLLRLYNDPTLWPNRYGWCWGGWVAPASIMGSVCCCKCFQMAGDTAREALSLRSCPYNNVELPGSIVQNHPRTSCSSSPASCSRTGPLAAPRKPHLAL